MSDNLPRPGNDLTDDQILRNAAIRLQNLRETHPERSLYGAKLAAANAWVNEARERLDKLMKEHERRQKAAKQPVAEKDPHMLYIELSVPGVGCITKMGITRDRYSVVPVHEPGFPDTVSVTYTWEGWRPQELNSGPAERRGKGFLTGDIVHDPEDGIETLAVKALQEYDLARARETLGLQENSTT